MVIRTKATETLLVALHFKSVNFLLQVTIPNSVELVRHNVRIMCQNFGKLAYGCQLMYRFITELYFYQQTWIQCTWINSGMLLQVLPPTLITNSLGTLSLVGSTADCGCPGRLWCQYLGSVTYHHRPGTLGLVGSTADCGCPGRLWCQHLGSVTYHDRPGTLGRVGSTADCGCPDPLWCQHHGSLTYVLKVHNWDVKPH